MTIKTFLSSHDHRIHGCPRVGDGFLRTFGCLWRPLEVLDLQMTPGVTARGLARAIEGSGGLLKVFSLSSRSDSLALLSVEDALVYQLATQAPLLTALHLVWGGRRDMVFYGVVMNVQVHILIQRERVADPLDALHGHATERYCNHQSELGTDRARVAGAVGSHPRHDVRVGQTGSQHCAVPLS